MNIPFSKNLAKNYLVPFIPLLVFSQLLFYNDTANLVQSNKQAFAIFAITSIVPIIYANMANNQHIHFKNREKGPQKERLFALPFSSSFASFIFAIVTLALGYGMAQLLQKDVQVSALLTLFTSAILLVLLIIAHEHPNIWYSDTFHMQDVFDKVKNTPKTDLPAYQDGIFSYTDHYFMLQEERIKKSIFWNEIRMITAYKKDQITTDLVAMEIYTESEVFSIDEETPGSMKFMEMAAKKLSPFKEDWYLTVITPAFAENRTIIYEKK